MAKDRHLNSEPKIGSCICLFVFHWMLNHEKQTNRFCQRIPYEYSHNENNLFTFLDHSHINFDSEYRHKLTSSMCFIAYYRKAQWNGNNFFSFCICIFRLCIYIFFFRFFYLIQCFAVFPFKMLCGILFCRIVFKLSLKIKHWLIFTQKFGTTIFFLLFFLSFFQ